ncbi:MAG TPA: imidazolonepropionase, partial [Homoserinimonas sp.]|nr:imidazolonepropionase [Homoserinimonas sp.]
MTSTIIDRVGLLVTNDETHGSLTAERSDAAVVIENGTIAWVGDAADAPAADTRIDAGGRCVIPGFVDSHSHLVFAGDRS